MLYSLDVCFEDVSGCVHTCAKYAWSEFVFMMHFLDDGPRLFAASNFGPFDGDALNGQSSNGPAHLQDLVACTYSVN